MKAKVEKQLMQGSQLQKALKHLAGEILRRHKSLEDVVLVGIKTRGDTLAQRLAGMIHKEAGRQLVVGALDIALYRDDVGLKGFQPVVRKTEIPFPLDEKTVLLVDDVLFTGRTVRAALSALVDFGRPKRIELVVLIDRGGKELPVAPDYTGHSVVVDPLQRVVVHLQEVDGVDEVVVIADS